MRHRRGRAFRRRHGHASRMAKWDVYQGKRHIDTVWFDASMSSDEVRRSLINRDGYGQNIVVLRGGR